MTLKTLLAVSSLTLASLAFQADAQAASFRHAAGFFCGLNGGEANPRIRPGEYRAAFNIRNASGRTATVDLELALTFPPAANFTPGAVVPLPSVSLAPGEAVMIDCAELQEAANAAPPYIAGVLEVRGPRGLDVTLIHTAGADNGSVASIAVTQVEGTRVRGGDDDD